MRRLVIAFAIASLLCGIWTPTSGVANALESEALSSKDRIEVFEAVWKTINDEYYDPTFNGVNWSAARERYRPRVEAVKGDEEFYAVISEMLSDLQDLHTSFVTPDTQPRSSGISVYEVENKIVVVSVDPDSDADRAGVKAGMIVCTFDGKPIDERLSQLRTKLGHWSIPQPRLISYRLPSGFSYMKINSVLRSPVEDQFETEFQQLKASRGLIIDLRGTNGGDIKGVGLKIANHFFPSKVSFGKFINQSGAVPLRLSLSAEGNSQTYKGPVAILIDETTASAGEVFASGFQENLRAKVIGQQSCGCVLDRDSKKVKGGGLLYYSHLGYVSSKGRKLEGAGVVPDNLHLTEPRVTPLPPSEWDDETRELMESLRRNGHVYNIFATLARHPQLLIGPDAPGLDSFEATLLRAVDELHTNSFICDSTWKALTERYNTQQVFDFLFTAGQYKLVSMVLNSAGVQLEEGFEGFSNETQG